MIGTHHQQHIFRGKHAVAGQNIKNGVLAEKGLGKVHKVGDNSVARIRPKGSKFKAVAGFLLFHLVGMCVFNVVKPGGIGVILCIGAVGHHKNLHILKQARSRPKAVPLVAVYLVERLPDGHAPPLEFNMHHRQAVDQNRHIIAVVVGRALLFGNSILVDDLQAVVVDVLFIEQRDVFAAAVIPAEHLHKVLLNEPGFFHYAAFGICQHLAEKASPFFIGKSVAVYRFQLKAQVVHQIFFLMYRKVFIAQFPQQADKLPLQLRLALVCLRAFGLRLVFGYNGAFARLSYDIKIRHWLSPLYNSNNCNNN